MIRKTGLKNGSAGRLHQVVMENIINAECWLYGMIGFSKSKTISKKCIL